MLLLKSAGCAFTEKLKNKIKEDNINGSKKEMGQDWPTSLCKEKEAYGQNCPKGKKKEKNN